MYYNNSFAIGYIIGGLISAVVFGFITKHINESKGYEGGFAWGFWLNIIGIIVVACKPDNRAYTPISSHNSNDLSPLAQEARERSILADGGWKCTCGRVNYHYVSTCWCGRNQSGVIYNKTFEEHKNPETEQLPQNNDNIALIKQLAELHSQGILTDEEFDTKKAEILAKM